MCRVLWLGCQGRPWLAGLLQGRGREQRATREQVTALRGLMSRAWRAVSLLKVLGWSERPLLVRWWLGPLRGARWLARLAKVWVW